MAKVKNPGFLSDDEKSYLRALENEMKPGLWVGNPSRTKARVGEFQKGLHRAIDIVVEDVRLMQFTGVTYKQEDISRQFSDGEVKSELIRCTSGDGFGALRFLFYEYPLHYLLVACLDALTKRTSNQRLAIVREIQLCLRYLDGIKEETKKHPKITETPPHVETSLEVLGEVMGLVREQISEVSAETDWLVDHSREKDIFLVIDAEDFERENEREVWVHRDGISKSLGFSKSLTTRLLSKLAEKGLIEGRNHLYRLTEKGRIVFLALSFHPMGGIL